MSADEQKESKFSLDEFADIALAMATHEAEMMLKFKKQDHEKASSKKPVDQK